MTNTEKRELAPARASAWTQRSASQETAGEHGPIELASSVVRVLSLVRQPRVTPEDLARHIAPDPKLTEHVLRLANSVLCSLRREVGSLREAIVVIGMTKLEQAVLLHGFAKILSRDMTVLGFAKAGLLAHSIAVSISARLLATRIWSGTEVPDRLFVAGLVHKLHWIYRMRMQRLAQVLGQHQPTTAFLDHSASLAVRALKTWGIDEAVINLVTQQRLPRSPTGQCKECAALRIATAVADSIAIGYAPGCAPSAIVNEADLELLSIHRQETWNALRESLVGEVERASFGLCGMLTSTG